MSEETSENDNDFYSLFDELDKEILMHRDVHFSGRFDFMIDYYEKSGKGVNLDFEIERIQELNLMEKELKQNLAALVLSGPEAERVAKGKFAYKELRDLYKIQNQKNPLPMLIADLILSEEEESLKEIIALKEYKTSASLLLIDLLKSEDFYDPLYPGYGLAPFAAAKALGEFGEKRAIISLFEAIKHSDFNHEDVVFKALKTIGNEAKNFLLKVVHSKPYNQDNEHAALALIPFNEDNEVTQTCFEILKDPEALKNLVLSTYLTLVCEGIKDPELRAQFIQLAENPAIPPTIRTDVKGIIKDWQL